MRTQQEFCPRKGKVRHETRAAATAARAATGHRRAEVYRCPWCVGFHIGLAKPVVERPKLSGTVSLRRALSRALAGGKLDKVRRIVALIREHDALQHQGDGQ